MPTPATAKTTQADGTKAPAPATPAAPGAAGPSGATPPARRRRRRTVPDRAFAPLSWDAVVAANAGTPGAELPEDFNGTGLTPAEPTSHPPGSPGKIEILAERAARRETLFHPDDKQDHTRVKRALRAMGG